MYFESVPHKTFYAQSARHAAYIIKNSKVEHYRAVRWKTKNGVFYAVNDMHIDGTPFFETAVIRKDKTGFTQVESITVGWIKTVEELSNYFTQAETSGFSIKVELIIGEPKDQTANFTCGCCGSWFKDSVKRQLKFDQDATYGICSKCENYYS